jgi:hypothetical protein
MGNVIRDHRGIDPRRLWLVLVAGLVGCPRPQDPALKGIDACRLRHSAGATQDPTNASDVCDGARLPDLSQLPAPLAGAGCTAMGTYQLGLGRKSLRYAICPAASTDCRCPVRRPDEPLACTTPLGRFVACFAADDFQSHAPFGFAHVLTSVCDACLGRALPPGMVMVTWHESEVCGPDSNTHDQAIQSAVPGSKPPPSGCSSGSAVGGQTGCKGGCMDQGPPPLP